MEGFEGRAATGSIFGFEAKRVGHDVVEQPLLMKWIPVAVQF